MREIIMRQLSEQDLRELMKEVFRETIREEMKTALHQAEPQKPLEEEYFTSEQVCKMLQVTKPTLHNYTKEGVIKAYRFGRSVRYLKSDIAASLQQVRSKSYRK